MGRSSERAMRTVFPSCASKANEPVISRTASAFPLKTRARASSTLIFRIRFTEGESRSTTFERYWVFTKSLYLKTHAAKTTFGSGRESLGAQEVQGKLL